MTDPTISICPDFVERNHGDNYDPQPECIVNLASDLDTATKRNQDVVKRVGG